MTFASLSVIHASLLFVASQAFGQTAEFTDFSPNPGTLGALLHVPPDTSPGLPLVVALHGCTQQAADFDNETGLANLADATPFLLLLPNQNPANMSNQCFRFYDQADNRPGQGESASILAMIDAVLAQHDADPARVYILGLSGGGGMTAAMMANHPERFAGGAILAGVPYGCNRPASAWDWLWSVYHYMPVDGLDATYACGIYGYDASDRSPRDWASYVTAVSGPRDTWPLLSLWQGGADDTVDPRNLQELTDQWTAVQGLDQTPDLIQSIGTATRSVYTDNSGAARIETWALPGFDHAVPIDPENACGTAGPHIADADLCAVRHIAAFWGLTP
ncbi:poly(3-hydroxybutyrate) depolymerase [Sagittula marina]|uniref:Poly(3-hydroxybutyrate) depolymerase n=1 Tax=Sagittula marina TaxID=943940 RepID=A0A7W6DSB0_9RHOB|nr:PHB depolymerase family esterase [Sagittula marina]MBB3985755.1 poly(3-hydroxybutyrate) depolymerase [Sagittula marina]